MTQMTQIDQEPQMAQMAQIDQDPQMAQMRQMTGEGAGPTPESGFR